MTGQIFINYRWDDSGGYTGRLYDRLKNHFGANQIYMDVDSVPPGTDIVQSIEDAIENCDIMLVVIGRDWLDIADEDGKRRLSDPEDLVRLEIAKALKRGMRLIPILVRNASTPHVDQLPNDIRLLARRKAFVLPHRSFDSDCDRLVQSLEGILIDERQKQATAEVAAREKKASRQPDVDADVIVRVETIKKIVICADNTWGTADMGQGHNQRPTNVAKIARGLLPRSSDGVVQIAHYESGIGTGTGLVENLTGAAFGHGLSAKVVNTYEFIVRNYEVEDEIFLFGFGSGAYMVRNLADLIDKIGILPGNYSFAAREGYRLYRSGASQEELEEFRTKHGCRDGVIKFIGVWDTVGAIGSSVLTRFKKDHQFHRAELSKNISSAYQALAIDERRRAFQPSLWTLSDGSAQTLQQVWFPGVHSDIGGGYAEDGLANVALHWMKRKAASYGIEFDESYFLYYRPWSGGMPHDSMTLMFRLWVPVWREIGKTTNGNESVHESAYKIMDESTEYRPRNLMAYIQQYGRDSV